MRPAAPGDAARIDATVNGLADLRGKALAADAPARPREPLEVRLSRRDGEVIGHAGFWSGEAVRRSDGLRVALRETPALPLWPSAWSSLQPPKIEAESVLGAARITGDGVQVLDAADVGQIAGQLAALSAAGFVPARQLDWTGAKRLQLTLVDGARIDVEQVEAADGQTMIRLRSDSKADVQAVRKFAFRIGQPLP